MKRTAENDNKGFSLNEKGFPLNEKGFSLVEALVSLVILTFVLTGLLQAIIIAGEANTKNSLRETAIKIAQERIEKVRTMARDTSTGGGWSRIVSEGGGPPPLSLTNVNFLNTKTVTYKNTTVAYYLTQTVAIAGNSKSITLKVTWTYRQTPYSYTTNAVVIQ
jgi:type IV pilus assembly protein PilV